MIQTLAVNGDSYMKYYAQGAGHQALASALGLQSTVDLSLPGACNDRIIRTTYRHSYQTDQPTFYVLGMTFLNRTELPVLDEATSDGHWISFQNHAVEKKWAWPWTNSDTEKFIDLHLKSQFVHMKDRIEDLMYKLLGLQADLLQRGHRLLVFQQAENRYQEFLQELVWLPESPVFIDQLSWCAIPWQLQSGAQPVKQDTLNSDVPKDMWHVDYNQHEILNKFLLNYINTHSILT